MSTATDSLTVVTSVPEEVGAAAIVGLLAEHGIKAIAIGGTTAGFRAEAPGQVQVVVAEADHARATAIVREQSRRIGGVDLEELGEPEEETSEASSHILQSRFWRYLVVSIVILVVLGLLTDTARILFDLVSRIMT